MALYKAFIWTSLEYIYLTIEATDREEARNFAHHWCREAGIKVNDYGIEMSAVLPARIIELNRKKRK